MSLSLHAVASTGLAMGVPLVLMVRGLIAARRASRGSGPGGISLEPPPRPPGPGPAQKPLPDCLIPKPYVEVRSTAPLEIA